MDEYNASEGAQEALAAEMTLVEGIRSDAGMNSDYWDAGYERGQWYTRGLRRHLRGTHPSRGANGGPAAAPATITVCLRAGPGALRRFPALLHEGERVQTAAQARAADAARAA